MSLFAGKAMMGFPVKKEGMVITLTIRCIIPNLTNRSFLHPLK